MTGFRATPVSMRLSAALSVVVLLPACRHGFTPIPVPEEGTDRRVEARVAEVGAADRGLGDRPTVADCPGPIASQDVDTVHDPGQYPSVAVDAQGNIHISHLAAGEPFDLFGNGGYWDARYSVRRGGAWQSEDISTSGVVGAFGAIGLGPAGEVHAVFYKDGDRDLLYARRDASGWKLTQDILSAGDSGWGTDLAVDASGTVHVVTFSRPSSGKDQVVYLRRVGASWEAPVVLEPDTFDTGPKSGIAVAPDGTVHVSLEDAAGHLKYRRGKDGVFEPAQIVDNGLVASASDIAVDGSGDAHIAYYDGGKKVLKLVGQRAGIFAAPMVLDSSGVVGSYHRIVATPSSDLWIAYYDFTNLDLRLIRRQGGSWGPPQTIDSAGHVGRYASAALGPDGALHIAHWNEDARALRHTRVCP